MSSLNTEVEDGTLPFRMNHLPEFYVRKAKRELNENLENRVGCLKEFKQLIESKDISRGVDFLDDLLLQFLRHSKYNVANAFTRLQNYISFRQKQAALFHSVSSVELLTSPSHRFCTVLPRRTADGCVVVLYQLENFSTDRMHFEDYKRIIVYTYAQSLRDPMAQISGYKQIYDFQGTTVKHIKFCTPQTAYLLYSGALECLPCRYKEMHFINESPAMKVFWAAIRIFLPQKIRNRVYFHSTVDELLDFFPRSVLPVKYGGELENYVMPDWLPDANEKHGLSTVRGQPNYY